jgi:preprotein translocase subunit SecG
MLAFMKDQGLSENSNQDGSGSNPGGPEDQQYFTVAARQKHARKSTFLLGTLFAIGILSLIYMIKQSGPQKAVADIEPAEAKIEVTISKLTGIRTDMFDRMDQIVNKFYEFSNFQQIHVNELVKNPFEHDLFLLNTDKANVIEIDPVDTTALLRKQVKLRASELKLVSIIQSTTPGSRSCCMIDDRIMYEGDSIKGFSLEKISERSIKLVWKQSGQEDIPIIIELN